MTELGPQGQRTEPQPRPPGWWSRYYTRTRAVVAGSVSALVVTLGLLQATLDLVDRVFGDEDPCPEVHVATLEKPTLDASVTRGQSLELVGASTQGISKDRLAQPGKLVSLNMTAEGYDGEPLAVWARLLTAGGAPVADLELRDVLVREWTPRGCTDALDAQVWLPVPRAAGDYVIRVQLRRKASRDAIRTARTDAFAVAAPAAS